MKKEYIDEIVLRNENLKLQMPTGEITGIPTGFIDYDYLTKGLQPGTVTIIAARPGMGTTSLALTLAKHLAVDNDYNACYFSFDILEKQLIERLLSLESRIGIDYLRGYLDEDKLSKIKKAGAILKKSRLIICDDLLTVDKLCYKCRKMKLENNLECIVIDYVQLLKTVNGRSIDYYEVYCQAAN